MKSKSKIWLKILVAGLILLFPYIAHAQTPINCGQTLAGVISAVGERDQYSFAASANDGISKSVLAHLEVATRPVGRKR